jgi:aspartyl-tRNA(Asn)/glutamyl-tRNA(Gln) amidotransferase subunit C
MESPREVRSETVITEREDSRNKRWHRFLAASASAASRLVEPCRYSAHGQAADLSGTLRALMPAPRISAESVRHVAKLACISLSAEEVTRMQRELDSILGYMAELDSVDVSNVPPAFEALDIHVPLRADEVAPSLDRQELLAGAPAQDQGGFAVPKVLEVD